MPRSGWVACTGMALKGRSSLWEGITKYISIQADDLYKTAEQTLHIGEIETAFCFL
jgi:hypothetical protein